MKPPAPYRPGHDGYVSEFGRFIDGYLQQHPEVRASQRQGWRIWWERPVNLGELERSGKDTVAEPPYHYR